MDKKLIIGSGVALGLLALYLSARKVGAPPASQQGVQVISVQFSIA